MSNWQSYLRADPIPWLLEEENPSVRYFTLRYILDRADGDPELDNAMCRIMETGAVPAILSLQDNGGFWSGAKRFYTHKYSGSVWQMLLLAELGADGNDSRIQKGCRFILENAYEPESGAFAMKSSAKRRGGLPNEVIPCLTGNMLWVLIRFGLLEDPRVQKGIGWVIRYQRYDDGTETPPSGWPYDRFEICWGRHTCHMSIVKNLKAFAAIPEANRTAGIRDVIEKSAEFLLIHHIHKRSHALDTVSKPGWLRLGFPLMYQTDILEILDILTGLGYRDPRMQEAVDILLEKQDETGRWTLQNSYNNDRMPVPIEVKGKPSKWITLNVLKTIKNYYG